MIQVNAAARLIAADSDKERHEKARGYLSTVSGLDIKGHEVNGQDDMSSFVIKSKDVDKAVENLTARFKKPKLTHDTRPYDADIWTWKLPEGKIEVRRVFVRGKTMSFIKLLY